VRFVRNQAEAERDSPTSLPDGDHHPCGQDVLNGLAQRRVAAHQVEDRRGGWQAVAWGGGIVRSNR